jgi:hypothetical protein
LVAKLELFEECYVSFVGEVDCSRLVEDLPCFVGFEADNFNTVAVDGDPLIELDGVLTIDIEELRAEVEEVVFGEDGDVVHGDFIADLGELVVDYVCTVGLLLGGETVV